MGFFDEYKDTDEGGLSYFSEEEKLAIVKTGTTLEVKRVVPPRELRHGPAYTLVVEHDGEDRGWTFSAGQVESRDRLLDAMAAYLERDDGTPGFERPIVRIVKSGNAYIIRNGLATE